MQNTKQESFKSFNLQNSNNSKNCGLLKQSTLLNQSTTSIKTKNSAENEFNE